MNPGCCLSSCLAIAVVFLTGCSTSPEVERKIQAKEARIDAILKTVSPPKSPQRCLNSNQYHHVRVMDERRIVFEGRRNQYWLNILPVQCPGLQRSDTIRIERLSSVSLCKFDTLYPLEWFSWPWYRRWPWYWNGAPKCTFGAFLPLTPDQVQQLDSTLDTSRD